ncbi:phosphotransferase (plasmid) [Nocardia sp. NBC_01377]|uniref:phosphotransferase family protein n=1 Tax=Nocardia sp. NBC_01377 TaxID=2903595 RepID=UPI002F913881
MLSHPDPQSALNIEDRHPVDIARGGLSGADVKSLYLRAVQDSSAAAAGFYNRNVRVAVGGSAVNVRVPIDGAAVMDVRQWPEPQILATIAPYVSDAPRLYAVNEQPRCQIQEYVHGHQLDQLAPRGTAVPDHVPTDVAALFADLRAIPIDALPSPTTDLDDHPHRFAHRLWGNTRRLHEGHRSEFAALFRRLDIPEDPFAPLSGAAGSLQARPFRLIHCDLHRKNMLIRAGRTVFLDWELALFGDPLADVAIHLLKMTYLPHEQDAFLTARAAVEPDAVSPGWREDLDRYLTHEKVKAAVIDAVRYAVVIAEHSRSPAGEQALVDGLTRRLADAGPLWDRAAPERDRVEAALRAH